MVLNPSKYQDTRTWKMTPAMIRARKPFFKGNMLGLTLLLGVTGSVYSVSYTHLDVYKRQRYRRFLISLSYW